MIIQMEYLVYLTKIFIRRDHIQIQSELKCQFDLIHSHVCIETNMIRSD